ncbi:MAG: hypothetical protein AAFQ94_05910 [Bacteroidota bacterium]
MKEIKIEFKTLEVPAPFAHNYLLHLKIDKEIEAQYEITYKGREELSEAEILEEGYTLDDDFKWSGKIDSSWKKSILGLADIVQQNESNQANEFSQTEISISLTTAGQTESTVYYDEESLSYQIQEIVQALFETSKRELPLKIQFLLKAKGKKDQFTATLSFATRSCSIFKNNELSKNLSWEEGSSLMSLIYQPDYLLDTTKTKKDDLYISFEENAWFSLDEIEESERLTGFKSELLKYLQ